MRPKTGKERFTLKKIKNENKKIINEKKKKKPPQLLDGAWHRGSGKRGRRRSGRKTRPVKLPGPAFGAALAEGEDAEPVNVP